MTVLDILLADVPTGWRVTDVHVGANWVVALVHHSDGTTRAGVAATPHPVASDAAFQPGHTALDRDAEQIAQGLRSPDMTAAAVALATLNALNQPDERLLTTDDAADWLSAQSAGRSIAIFGRFPFIEEEVRPFASRVWVFEQQPQPGELGGEAVGAVLPQADIVAITGSSVINHTIDGILGQVRHGCVTVILGPSTPLSVKLLDSGIDALFGVSAVDVPSLIRTVAAGSGFQKVEGLRRVALFRRESPKVRGGL